MLRFESQVHHSGFLHMSRPTGRYPLLRTGFVHVVMNTLGRQASRYRKLRLHVSRRSVNDMVGSEILVRGKITLRMQSRPAATRTDSR